MSDAVLITLIICGTILMITWFGNEDQDNKK